MAVSFRWFPNWKRRDTPSACRWPKMRHLATMLNADLSRAVLQLPPEERLELARRLVESVADPVPLSPAVQAGIRRIEDLAAGRLTGLTEEQYRAALA